MEMNLFVHWTLILTPMAAVGLPVAGAADDRNGSGDRALDPLDFAIRLETVLKHDDGQFLWFHPRVAAIPGAGRDGGPAVVMTLQKHLHVSDHYSGLNVMRTEDLGASWTAPDLRPELDWVEEAAGVHVAVCDVTPGWHAPTGKLLAIGAQVRYSEQGEQLEDQARAHQTAYAVFDPQTGNWSKWKVLEMPPDEKFNFARSACAQWLVQPDGTLLLPFYFGLSASVPSSVTVVQCSFDGEEIQYLQHGDELELNVVRGLCEPSLIFFQGRYYLTLRNDLQGYVTVGDDGLHFQPIQPWTFDDGTELGSYNTQQHWLAHSDGLFLVYTRRGANNDHIMRHRAPLFLGQVDPEKLHVIRRTERILIPERGATLGNFGAAAINENESWVTVAEGVWNDDARKRGAEGAVFVARVIWSRPNRMARQEMLASESPEKVAETKTPTTESGRDGVMLDGFTFANIVPLKDGRLITESGQESTDGGRTWSQSPTFQSAGGLGLLRLPNGELGTYYADRWDMTTALGNATNNWFFKWSADAGQTWSDPVKITLDGLTQGLQGTMFALRDGRLIIVTYSQFLGSRFDLRGASWGTFQGVRFQTETEGHFPLAEVGRAYYSDDQGRSWQPCDGWVMGWREEGKWTDAFTEPDAVELQTDGHLLMIGRTLTGRLYQARSTDRGHSWWPGAQPMPLMAAYSPARICRLPKTEDLLILWNQHSRAEIRQGFRRSRLSTAISRDEGQTWEHFKNLEAIASLADVTPIPADPDLTPVVGDDEVGAVPDDYANFHYPALAVVGEEVFITYLVSRYYVATDEDGHQSVQCANTYRTRILPVEWFYQ